MTVLDLKSFIDMELQSGNLKKGENVIFTAYMNSEWGQIDFSVGKVEAVEGSLLLHEE